MSIAHFSLLPLPLLRLHTIPSLQRLLRSLRPTLPKNMVMPPNHLLMNPLQRPLHPKSSLLLRSRTAGQQREKAVPKLLLNVIIILFLKRLDKLLRLVA